MTQEVEPRDTHKAISEARDAQRLTTRQFAEALSVSQNSVYQWEHNIAEPTEERIRAWLVDPRPWVKQLGFNLFMARHGDTLAEISSAIAAFTAAPKAA